jgi:hypothetical protein
LKSLHKWYYQTQHDFGIWLRWIRKRPENRKGPEPTFCKFFLRRNFYSYCGGKVSAYLDDKGFVELYQRTRHPSTTPVEPLDGSDIEKINRAYAEVASYFLAG